MPVLFTSRDHPPISLIFQFIGAIRAICGLPSSLDAWFGFSAFLLRFLFEFWISDFGFDLPFLSQQAARRSPGSYLLGRRPTPWGTVAHGRAAHATVASI